MRLKTACLAIIVSGTAVAGVAADALMDDEPVLRLRFVDTTPVTAMVVPLRPRFETRFAPQPAKVQAPKVELSEAGRVGTFANISTPHPNLVVTVGATEDASELGRQIDRAITEMARGEQLFNRQSDSAPFIGLGVRSGSNQAGWSANAAIGVGVHNPPDRARLSTLPGDRLAAQYEAEASAHFRLRYTF